jgi:hypothetical protein
MSGNDLRAVLPTEWEHNDQVLVAITPDLVIEPVC